MFAVTSPQSLPLHAHGTPNWVDLHTGHIDKARLFYDALLDWSFHHRFTLTAVSDRLHPAAEPGPAGPSNTLMAFRNEQPVAELVERGSTFDEAAMLSNWFPYVYVDDLDATLALVEPAGGLVLGPPAERSDLARVATILDPSDALLCLWEPATSIGSSSLHRPGALAWIELETTDLDRARKFYGDLFGWDGGEVESPGQPGPYLVFTSNGERVAGATETPLSQLPASWCPSFAVPEVDLATAVATEHGGVVMVEPTDMPVGRQSVLVDPVGAVVGLLGPVSQGPRPL